MILIRWNGIEYTSPMDQYAKKKDIHTLKTNMDTQNDGLEEELPFNFQP